MNKVWAYVSAALAGMVLGIIIGAKWVAGKDVHVEVKKIKNRRSIGDTTVPVNIDQKPNRRERRKNK